jgi:hypothetical protein
MVTICTAQWSLYVPPLVTTCTAQWSLYVQHSDHCMYRQWALHVPHSGHYMYPPVVTICTASGHYVPPVVICTTILTFSSSTFRPHSVFMCFVWISEQTAIIALYSINLLVCITETQCVYCAVRTGCLNVIPGNLGLI